jgi:two-component system, NarL family, nitrate/nitrite response regulator NarL
MHSPIRVAVIDTCPLYRTGVVQALARNPHFRAVAEGASAADAQRAVREEYPHVLLLNMGVLERFDPRQDIASAPSQCKIVVLTARDDPVSVSKALATGVTGYILKAVSGSELAQALATIDAGKPFVTPELASRLLTDAQGGPLVPKWTQRATLSYREQQMLEHASKGLTNYEIAEKLGLKVSTIKHYMTRVFRKVKASNRLQAIHASQLLLHSEHAQALPNY